MPTKRKPELVPGEPFTFIGEDWERYIVRELPVDMLGVGAQFTTERGLFEITRINNGSIETKYVSAETEKGPTGDVRV